MKQSTLTQHYQRTSQPLTGLKQKKKKDKIKQTTLTQLSFVTLASNEDKDQTLASNEDKDQTLPSKPSALPSNAQQSLYPFEVKQFYAKFDASPRKYQRKTLSKKKCRKCMQEYFVYHDCKQIN